MIGLMINWSADWLTACLNDLYTIYSINGSINKSILYLFIWFVDDFFWLVGWLSRIEHFLHYKRGFFLLAHRGQRILKHTTTLFSLSDYDIPSREWRVNMVNVHQVQTNYHGIGLYGTIISQACPNYWLWGIFTMVGCVLSQLKPSEIYILSFEEGRGLLQS